MIINALDFGVKVDLTAYSSSTGVGMSVGTNIDSLALFHLRRSEVSSISSGTPSTYDFEKKYSIHIAFYPNNSINSLLIQTDDKDICVYMFECLCNEIDISYEAFAELYPESVI